MNSNGIILLAALAAMGLLIVANKPTQADDLEMEDQMIDIANIRKGVANGWYTAVLTRIDNKPAIRLTGNNTSGEQITDVFWISQDDFDTLQSEGYIIEL